MPILKFAANRNIAQQCARQNLDQSKARLAPFPMCNKNSFQRNVKTFEIYVEGAKGTKGGKKTPLEKLDL